MNNKEYIAELAERAGYTQTDTQQMVRTIVETMSAAFEAGDTVQKQRMLVPPKLVLSFKPIVAIKEDLKNT